MALKISLQQNDTFQSIKFEPKKGNKSEKPIQ